MALVSVSLEVLPQVQQWRAWPPSAPLASLRTACGHRASELEDAGFLVCYRVDAADLTLYELAVRTGDVLFLTPASQRPPSGTGDERYIGMNVLHPSGDVLEVSDHATVGDLQQELARYARVRGRVDLYVGRYIVDLSATLEDYRLTTGDIVSLAMLPATTSTVLMLVPARGAFSPFEVRVPAAVVGRSRPGEPVAVDIGNILPRRKRNAVQGPQAELTRLQDVWHVEVLPAANVPIFVDSQRLYPFRPRPLFENNVISFGSSPNEPLLQLVVRFETE